MCQTALDLHAQGQGSLLHRIKREAWAQLKLGSPVTLTMILKSAVPVISVVFVGHVGSHELAAAALATLTANVTGHSLIVGMSGALSTLCAQAYGAKDFETLGLSLQRAMLIMLSTCLPISVLWMCSESLFIMVGQKPSVAAAAAEYLMLLIPSLWTNAGVQSLQAWLYSMGRSSAVGVASAVVALAHAPLCYLFIYGLGMSYQGAAMAVSMNGLLLLLLVIGYVWWYKVLEETHFQLSSRCFSDWWPFFKIALPNLLMMSEWWASEALVFMAGSLADPETQLAAMSVFQTTNGLSFMVPQGFHVAAAAHVGNALGASDPASAKLSALVAPIGAGLMGATSATLLAVFSNPWARLFTNDDAVASVAAHIFRILWFYFIADAIQCALTGVVKGAGRQNIGGPVVFASYYLVGLPLAACFAFEWGLNIGTVGLLLGNTVGCYTHMIVYSLFVWRMDWQKEVKATQERLAGFHAKKSASTETSLSDGQEQDDVELAVMLQSESRSPQAPEEIGQPKPRGLSSWLSSVLHKREGYAQVQSDSSPAFTISEDAEDNVVAL